MDGGPPGASQWMEQLQASCPLLLLPVARIRPSIELFDVVGPFFWVGSFPHFPFVAGPWCVVRAFSAVKMNEHSFMPLPPRGPPLPHRRPSAATSATHLLRAAIDTFAARGFFNAQVADVARAAGVAAGTVYLYFRGKDDLLISIFDDDEARRSPRAGATASRRSTTRRAAARASPRCTSIGSAATATWRSCSRSSCASRRSSWSASRPRTARLPRHHPRRHRRRPGAGRLPRDVNPTLAAKLLFGALDEMATNWILSQRRYSLAGEADAIVDLFVHGVGPGRGVARDRASAAVLGAGTMGAQIAAHFANAGVPSLLLDVTPEAAREGLERARRSSPIRSSRPTPSR